MPLQNGKWDCERQAGPGAELLHTSVSQNLSRAKSCARACGCTKKLGNAPRAFFEPAWTMPCVQLQDLLGIA
eukprot:scaffold105474_cov19-Tisochrysis_lutea.AAC.2